MPPVNPLTYDEAYAATNPADSDEVREASANRILLGDRANAAYWDSRPMIERLQATAEGHGQVARGGDEEAPTEVGTPTDPNVIEGNATDAPTTALGTGEPATPVVATADAPPVDVPAGDSESAEDKLRAQLRAAGIDPEA